MMEPQRGEVERLAGADLNDKGFRFLEARIEIKIWIQGVNKQPWPAHGLGEVL